MSDELKPCPFCGSESAPHVTDCIETMVCHNIAECDDETLFWVTCSVLRGGCGAEAGYVRTKSEAVSAWNARAAVTDEQFAMAVHDGRAWQAVRECRNENAREPMAGAFEVGGVFRCSECGESYRYTELPYPFCPSCGAKVVG